MKSTLLTALATVVLCTVALYLAPGENEPPRILRPPDRSVLPFGPVEIAVIVPSAVEAPPILLDGKKLKLSLPGAEAKAQASPFQRLSDGVFLPPALITLRSLPPGLHELRAGSAAVRFFIPDREGKNVPPAGWQQYVPHPPAASETVTCTACHELTKERRFANMTAAFSMEKPSTCFDCHDRFQFNITHTHRYESLAFCQICHDPHGSSSDHLLKMPREKGCTLCHD